MIFLFPMWYVFIKWNSVKVKLLVYKQTLEGVWTRMIELVNWISVTVPCVLNFTHSIFFFIIIYSSLLLSFWCEQGSSGCGYMLVWSVDVWVMDICASKLS